MNIQRVIVNDIWTRQNEERNYQWANAGYTSGFGALFARSEMVEDGSYLRLETARLAYAIPTKLLKKYKVGSMKLYITGQNLGILTRYSWHDPEANAARGDNRQFLPGVDQGSYPRTRTILGGLDVSF